jgi:hypothetical protein
MNVGRFKAKCSDGTVLNDMGGGGSNVMGGYAFQPYDAPAGGWNEITGYSNNNNVTLFHSGAQAGNYTDARCPAGMKISGYGGWTGWWVDGVRFYCSSMQPTPNAVPTTPPSSTTTTTPAVVPQSVPNTTVEVVNVPAPAPVTVTNPTNTVTNPDGSTTTSTLDTTTNTTKSTTTYSDGSKLNTTTANGVTVVDTAPLAWYNKLTSTQRALLWLVILIALVALVYKVKSKNASTNSMHPLMQPGMPQYGQPMHR